MSRVIKGESLGNRHLIIARRAKSIIIIIITTIRRVLSRIERRRMSKITETRLLLSDVTNSSVHLTHLIRKMVKTTTKINTHVLKLIQNGSKRCIYSKIGRRSKR